MSSATRVPRGRRGTFATITALLAVLVCAFGATEAISLAANRRGLWLSAATVAKFGRDTQLSDTVVMIVGIVVFAVGVVLVLAAIVPSRRHLVQLHQQDGSVAAGLTRRSLRRTLAAAARGVDGVTAAKVRGRRKYKVRAWTSLRDVSDLPGRVDSAVRDRLDQLQPARRRSVRVKLRRKDD